ncbi:YggT family protein [Bosea sp. AAP35]|uniref:YggT family protein n=1 Tax=Bosea sp. AAP35 TaxID=1523417 RepID=UPI0006B8BCE1|nr:YggT family protein [Bosea sp. AAP35]
MAQEAGFWLFHIPNIMLAAAIYTLLGRYILSLLFPPESEKVVWRVFKQITDPILNAVRVVTPAIVPPPLLNLFAIIWLLLLRVAFYFLIRSLGLLPIVPGAAT